MVLGIAFVAGEEGKLPVPSAAPPATRQLSGPFSVAGSVGSCSCSPSLCWGGSRDSSLQPKGQAPSYGPIVIPIVISYSHIVL